MAWDEGMSGVVVLPGGLLVRGRSRRTPVLVPPDWGLYLRGRRPSPTAWPHRWVRWPDFALPLDATDARDALVEARRRAASERVEIGCGHGLGRTGTALAALAILDGLNSDAAVAWVRDAYHPRAIDTPWQRAWLRRFARR